MVLELKNVYKSYGSNIIFEDLNIDFSKSGFYLLTGVSGSGKTTLLNLLAGFEGFNKGTRSIENVSMACIFQSYELIEQLTVLENIKMSVDLCGNSFDETLLHQLGLSDILHHYPNELSGGQKQRVGIARALYQNPNVIMCDEPTESLDIENKEIVLNLLKELSKDKIVIVSSHEFEVVKKYYDYHYAIENHQLVCKDIRSENKIVLANNISTGYQKKQLSYYISRIVSKRTRFFCAGLAIFLFIQMALYIIDVEMFKPKTSLNALNGHISYVNLMNEEVDFLDGYSGDKKPILDFEPFEWNSKKIKMNIYPLENENYQLNGNEIFINQLALDVFGKGNKQAIIGTELELTYTVDGLYYSKVFKIKDVVSEPDAYYPQIYYCENTILEDLKQITPYNEFDSLYNCFISTSKSYEIINDSANANRVINTYKGLSSSIDVRSTHSILEMRLQNEKQKVLYHLIFQIIEWMGFIVNIGLIIYFNKKDSDQNKTALSLIYSLQIPLKAIKWTYFKHKAIYMLLASLILMLVTYIIHLLFIPLPISLLFIYIGLMFVIYIVSLFIQMLIFKHEDISLILKDNKD